MSVHPRRSPLPAGIVICALLALGVIAVPLVALATRVRWTTLPATLREPETAELLSVSLAAAGCSTVIVVVLGIPAALWLNNLGRGRVASAALRLLTLLPLALPPVVGGLALSAAFGRAGLLGIPLSFTFAGVVAAHVFVCLPFVVLTADAALRQLDSEITRSAASLGLSPRRVVWRVLLPTLRPSIGTGAALAAARSLGEFGTTLTFAGSLPGVTRTMPLGIYLERELNPERTYALAAVLVLIAVLILLMGALPALLTRPPQPRAHTLEPLDVVRLAELTGASQPVALTVDGTVFAPRHLHAIVGPNGSGKSTLAAAIAGHVRRGEIFLGGERIDALPAHRRGVVVLTQRPGLPPRGTVAGAITTVTRDRVRTRELLAAAGLSALHDTPTAALSGGQAAQVALVRALAARPRVLILDEPLAAVDVASTAAWHRLLARLAQERALLLVTHNPLELGALADTVTVLEGGNIVASGPVDEMLALPPTAFVASLAGVNRVTGDVVKQDGDMAILRVGEDTLTGMSTAPLDARGVAIFTPEAVTLRRQSTMPIDESARNLWSTKVEDITAGSRSRVDVTFPVGGQPIVASITRASALQLGIAPGVSVAASTKALNVSIYPLP